MLQRRLLTRLGLLWGEQVQTAVLVDAAGVATTESLVYSDGRRCIARGSYYLDLILAISNGPVASPGADGFDGLEKRALVPGDADLLYLGLLVEDDDVGLPFD